VIGIGSKVRSIVALFWAVVCCVVGTVGIAQAGEPTADGSTWSEADGDIPASDGRPEVGRDSAAIEYAPAALVVAPPVFPPTPEGVVRLRDRNILEIRTGQGAKSPAARAQAASQALERMLDEHDFPDVHVEEQGDLAVVFGGAVPIVQLRPADAAAAGDASLSIHAASVAAKISEALRSERQRKAIIEMVFALSLFVFSALIAVLLLGKLRELAGKAHAWVEGHPEKLPALRIHRIDLVRAAAVRGALLVALRIGRLLSQLGIAYGWILFATSLFDSTRTYTERLTGFVLTPLSALIGRVGSALPLLVIAMAALLATVLLVRFVGLFFGSVARGETTVGWLPSDLAVPTGALVRIGIVIAALLLAAPLITGNDDGALARAGVAALLAVGFASAPVLASVGAGIPAVYGRKVRVGDYAEVGGRAGRVLAVNLLEVRLEDGEGCEIRVPHLMSLLHPTRIVGGSPAARLEVTVDPGAPQAQVRALLLDVARRFGSPCQVDLLRLDADGAHYRVVARRSSLAPEADLATAVADALEQDGIGLGRARTERA
jgi:small-conductance mechanosensitive channel